MNIQITNKSINPIIEISYSPPIYKKSLVLNTANEDLDTAIKLCKICLEDLQKLRGTNA